ncbi:MAG: hypothetical protein K2X53_04975 [Alphaproteobacteria bacterium]|nr:hypothetical protein [Alphaproteobacteria bacterium]
MQHDLFPSSSPSATTHPVTQKAKGGFTSAFIPATLENGLDNQKVVDHAMMWLRSLTKNAKNNAEAFLFHQMNEMKFKKSEYDQVSVVRTSIVRSRSPRK